MLFKRPFLDNPAFGWKHDLPHPNQPPSMEPCPNFLTNPPNHIDEIYLEMARSDLRIRGISVWLAIFMFALAAVFIALFMLGAARLYSNPPSIWLGSLSVMLVLFVILSGLYFWRIDTEAPRDEPIRFNRARRKVYVYRFHHDGLRPFSRSAWGIRTEVYDWDNLHAEACRVYGPMGTGGVIEAVTLAVLEPGTNKVLDRFHFAHDIQQGEMYWAMAQLFMQQGPHALPTFEYLPRDWNNEDVSYNLARRLAPKVKWPHAMDLESRTAP